MPRYLLLTLAMLAAAVLRSHVYAGTLNVVSTHPPMNSGNVAPGTGISVTFNQPVQPSSVTSASFWAFARWSGAAEGPITFSNDNQTVTLTPNQRFSAGESVMVILSHNIQGADGSPLRAAGYSWQFMIR